MLRWRLVSAAVILIVLLGLLYLDFSHPLGAPGIWLLPLGVAAAAMMGQELVTLWSDREDVPRRWLVYGGSPLIVLAAATPVIWQLAGTSYPVTCPLGPLGWSLAALLLALALAVVTEMADYREPGPATGRIALSLLAFVYAGFLVGFLVHLRIGFGHRQGMVALLSLVLIVKLSDTGAYFAGRLWGKHKLSPKLSPGKTVEGLLGALATTGVAGYLCYAVVAPWLLAPGTSAGSLTAWLVYAYLISVCGMLGDLAESMIKRDAQQKDSSSWLPGLGGVMDVLDSVIFAAPAAYFFFSTGLLGTQ